MNKRITFIIIVIGIIFIYYATGLNKILTLEMLQENKEIFLSFVNNHYFISVLLFILLYIIATALSLPIASLLTLLGGFLFGTFVGGAYIVVSATIGAYIIYLLAKSILRDWCIKKIGNGKNIQKIQTELEQHGFNHLLFLRLVPLFPFFLVNIAPAFVKFKDRDYILATLIGIIPGTLVYANVGQQLEKIDSMHGVVSTSTLLAFALLGLLSLIPTLIRKFKKKS